MDELGYSQQCGMQIECCCVSGTLRVIGTVAMTVTVNSMIVDGQHIKQCVKHL